MIIHGHTKGNGWRSTAYMCWSSLKDRCSNPRNKSYKNYGGRGISFDQRWNKFENFLKDMGNKPDNLSIDRIDNDGNYCKSNCRWTDRKTQNRNYRGCRLSLAQVKKIRDSKEPQNILAEKYGVDPSHISRIKSKQVWL